MESKNNRNCDNCGNYVDEDYFPCNVCNGIVNYFSIEKTVPMLCFEHGGSEACEELNKKFGFTCPKCDVWYCKKVISCYNRGVR